MGKIYCKRCAEQCFKGDIHEVWDYKSGNIFKCCSKGCYDIIEDHIFDQYCNTCDLGTGIFVCRKCIKHKENANITCATCDCDYDTSFKINDDINKYICKWCRKTINQYLSNKDIISKYIELTS